ncbi:MAG TPA: hypothetical protein VIT43_04085 [Candidatus Dormibacteraeota bacterium]
MIVYLPALSFVIGLIGAYGSSGVRRQAGTLLMGLAVVWALALLLDPNAAWWGAGCLLASLLLPRPRARVASTFEVLSRRTLTLAGMLVVALFLAAQLPAGESPLLLTAVPWFLGAVGSAWVLSPIDARERAQGQVLMIAATAALILVAQPGGPLTALAAGAIALVPVVAERRWIRPRWRTLMSSLMLGAGAALALLALIAITIPRQSVGDLGVNFAGPVLLGGAIALVAAALASPLTTEWAGILAMLALLVTAPAFRWAAVAGLIALATAMDRDGERPAWAALAAFAAVPILQGLAPASFSARFQAVALGTGLVLALYAARGGLLRAVVLPTIGFLVLLSMSSLSSGNLTRIQWIAAVGALVLVARTVLIRVQRQPRRASTRDALMMGLLLLAISARDALGLGGLGGALLLIDLALVQRDYPIGEGSRFANRLVLLAHSNWPPAISFAGATLAVIAALQASLALGLLAALMLAALQLSPLIDRVGSEAGVERPRSRWQWVGPIMSLACGVAPAAVLRMLRM